MIRPIFVAFYNIWLINQINIIELFYKCYAIIIKAELEYRNFIYTVFISSISVKRRMKTLFALKNGMICSTVVHRRASVPVSLLLQ